MKRRLIKVIKGETGQVLPAVLVLMLIGGLLIAPSLSYAATSLNVGQIVEEKVNGLYAADAGIEDALWKLKNDSPISGPYQLPEPVNQMAVAIDTEDMGIYTLYAGGVLEVTAQHYYWLAVDGEMGEWEEAEEAYPYTITVTWQAEPGYPPIKLREVGVRLPVGYSYQSGSAAIFLANLSTVEPDDTLDGAGAQMLNWEFGSPRPDVSEGEPVTQTFYVTGEEALEGDYSWVQARSSGIDVVGEVIGTVYRITATATSDSGSSTTIETYVLVSSVDYTIVDGNFTLDEGDAHTGNVYAGGSVELDDEATITGDDDLPYEGCGLSLSGSLQILSWEIN